MPNMLPYANGIPGGTQGPGSQAIAQGYNTGYGDLQNALKLSQNTTSGQVHALGQQLQQNQGNVQQGLMNSGLSNSTINATMQQAPLETYNQGVLNAQNQGAEMQMGAYGNMANLAAQGGQAIGNYYSPFAQMDAQHNMQQPQMQQLGGVGANGPNGNNQAQGFQPQMQQYPQQSQGGSDTYGGGGNLSPQGGDYMSALASFLAIQNMANTDSQTSAPNTAQPAGASDPYADYAPNQDNSNG